MARRGADGRFIQGSGSNSGLEIDENGLRAMGATMQEAINELAERVAEDARDDAPVISGMLRDSIGVKKDYAKLKALVVADAPHAGLVHNGTSQGAEANPFVRKAAERNFEKLKDRPE